MGVAVFSWGTSLFFRLLGFGASSRKDRRGGLRSAHDDRFFDCRSVLAGRVSAGCHRCLGDKDHLHDLSCWDSVAAVCVCLARVVRPVELGVRRKHLAMANLEIHMNFRTSTTPTLVLITLSLLLICAAGLFVVIFGLIESMSLADAYPTASELVTLVERSNDLASVKKVCVGIAEHIVKDMASSVNVLDSAKYIALVGVWFAFASAVVCTMTLAWVARLTKRLRVYEKALQESGVSMDINASRR